MQVQIPADTYSSGASVFFAMKTQVDDVSDDSSAVLKKTLTDSDIVVQGDDMIVVYSLHFAPADTNAVALGTYLAEIQFVSADKATVITYPDPEVAVWEFTVSGDINRRTS